MYGNRLGFAGALSIAVLGSACDRSSQTMAGEPGASPAKTDTGGAAANPYVGGAPAPAANEAAAVPAGTIDATGKPIDGIKLSQHDVDVLSPSLAIGPDGTIHVAYVEEHKSTHTYGAYHRSSSDGGQSWTEPKNLSEIYPDNQALTCQTVVDGKGRVYVVWSRGGTDERGRPNPTYGMNLSYRVLENGKWTRGIDLLNPLTTNATHDDGVRYWFASVDAAGQVQLIWDMFPDRFHPEVKSPDNQRHVTRINAGLLMQATLDGANAGQAREAYMAKVTFEAGRPKYPERCDGFAELNGYFDADGKPHILADLVMENVYGARPTFQLIEGTERKTAIELPCDLREVRVYSSPPALLRDAKGRQHLIWLNPGGERQGIRDTTIGSNDEPEAIRSTPAATGRADGFQAFQGPDGKMLVFMQFRDGGLSDDGDTYFSTSTGGAWTQPVNLTNNAARKQWVAQVQSRQSGKVNSTSFSPRPVAAVVDKAGHVLVAMLVVQFDLFASVQPGANRDIGTVMITGKVGTPTLRFIRL